MNIEDLLNNKSNQKKELGYDLKDDLVFFMNNDPEFYRKRYFPSAIKFDQYCKEGKKVSPNGFKKLVKEAYSIYKNKFPVEGLEKELSDDMCEEICKEIHSMETTNSKNGVYDLED
jgi:hypothetical protein